MRVLLTGATGFIGSHLKPLLENNGHQVLVVSRRKGADYDWSPENLERGVQETDAVCHLAGENLFAKRWSEKQKQELWRSRVDTTRTLAKLCAQKGAAATRLVSGSAIGYYGSSETDEFDEHSACGGGFLAELCRDWEEATEAALEAGVPTSIVRTGVVLGHGGGALEKMLPPFRFGVGGPLGNGRQWVSWIHVGDLAALFADLIESRQKTGIFNGCAPQPVTMKGLAKALGSAMHRPALFPVPGPVLRLAVGEAADVLLTGQKVHPKRTLEAGFTFRFPDITSALADLVGKPTAAAAT